MHNSSDPLCEMASVTMSGLTTDVYRQEGEELDWTTHHACHVVSAERCRVWTPGDQNSRNHHRRLQHSHL